MSILLAARLKENFEEKEKKAVKARAKAKAAMEKRKQERDRSTVSVRSCAPEVSQQTVKEKTSLQGQLKSLKPLAKRTTKATPTAKEKENPH